MLVRRRTSTGELRTFCGYLELVVRIIVVLRLPPRTAALALRIRLGVVSQKSAIRVSGESGRSRAQAPSHAPPRIFIHDVDIAIRLGPVACCGEAVLSEAIPGPVWRLNARHYLTICSPMAAPLRNGTAAFRMGSASGRRTAQVVLGLGRRRPHSRRGREAEDQARNPYRRAVRGMIGICTRR